MRQRIPVSQNGLLAAMNVAIEAAGTHDSVALVHHTVTRMSEARAAAVAARNAREREKEELRKLRQLLERERLATREFALLGRDQLKPALGRLYHAGWDVVGFKGGFRVSERASDLEVWAETFGRYLATNPGREVLAQNITAAHAEERYIALRNARAAVNEGEGILTALIQASDAAFAVLLRMLRGLVKELSLLLPPDDGRWTAFGFNLPAAVERPETPENVTVKLVDKDAAEVNWDKVPRAVHHRVWVQLIGVDSEPVAVGNPADQRFLIGTLQPTSILKVWISALNKGGESARSGAVTLTVPSGDGIGNT